MEFPTTSESLMDMDNGTVANFSTVDDLSYSKIEAFRIYDDYIHCYLGLTLCIIGSVFNIFNIIVFTRKNMISPINAIFTHLAIADLFVVLLFIPLCLGVIPFDSVNSFVTEMSFLSYIYLIQLFANVSTWLTVAMSVFRLKSVTYFSLSNNWYCMKTVSNVVTVIFVGGLSFQLTDLLFAAMAAAKYFKVGALGTLVSDDVSECMIRMYAITIGIGFRIVPSVLVAVFCLRLAFILRKTNKKLRKLTKSCNANKNDREEEKHIARANLILIIISLIYLVTLIPRGVLHLCYIIDPKLYRQLISNLKKIFEILVVINSTFPFVVYYGICPMFRATFGATFSDTVDDSVPNFSPTKKSVVRMSSYTDIIRRKVQLVKFSSVETY